MISISDPIKNPNQIKYHLAMARVGYYANLYEDTGQWAGKGAELLGLKGPVTEEVLRNLFEGYSKDGKTKLVQNAGSPDRQRAVDMVVTPPKSVSVYWAMAEPSEQATLLRLHHEAVNAAREFLEEKAGLTRRGQGGQRIEPAGMVFACFDHYTSRANDPNLHTHLVALNVVVREDGTTGALHNTGLFDHRAEADMIYKVHFALGLMLEMGLQVEEEGHGFRIVGVPKEVCDVFSKRRAQILEYLDENGLSGAAAASIAAVATRPAKQHITRENLIAECHRIGRALGWGPEEAAALGRETKVRKLAAKYAHLLKPEAESGEQGNRSSEGKTHEHSKTSRPERQATPTDSDMSNPSGRKDQSDRRESEHNHSSHSGGHRERTKSEHGQTWSSYDGRDGDGGAHKDGSWDTKGDANDSAKGAEQARNKSSLFRQVSRGNFVLKHARWGDILWKVNLGIVEIRIQKKRLFPKSPGINPASELAAPALRIVPWRIKLFEKTPLHKRKQPVLLWKKAFLLAELRLQRERLFHDAPRWSPIKNVEITRVKVGWRTSEIPESEKKKKQEKSESGNQSQGMGQSL